jgi:hypothetical protein
MTRVLPSLAKRGRFLFDWDAAACLAAPEQSLDAVTGQVATFTRASIKSAYDAAGVLRIVPHSLPAFEWAMDPVSGRRVPGVLVEAAATNLALHSQNLAGAAWTSSGVGSILSDAKVGPDGTLTADAPIETATNAEHYTQQQLSGIADNTTLAWSVSLQAGRQFLYVSFVKKDGATVIGAVFDVVNGIVISSDAGITGRIRAQANGFFRCTVIGSIGAGASQPWIRMQARVGGSSTFLGVVGTGYWATDMQCEAATSESSRIITGAATVPRSADLLSYAFNAVPGAMTLYAKFTELSRLNGGTNMTVATIGNPGQPWTIQIYKETVTPSYGGDRYGATLAGAGIAVTPPVSGTLVELRDAVDATGALTFGMSINGAAESTSPSALTRVPDAAFTAQTLFVGDTTPGGPTSTLFHKVRVAAGVQSLAFMQAG